MSNIIQFSSGTEKEDLQAKNLKKLTDETGLTADGMRAIESAVTIEMMQNLMHADTLLDCICFGNLAFLSILDHSSKILNFKGEVIPFRWPVMKLPSLSHDVFHGTIDIFQTKEVTPKSKLQVFIYQSYLFTTAHDLALYIYGTEKYYLENALDVSLLSKEEYISRIERALCYAFDEAGLKVTRKDFLFSFFHSHVTDVIDYCKFHSAVQFILTQWAAMETEIL